MPNEITAEMLACKMSELNGTGSGPGWEEEAGVFLLATRAFASLQAERAKDAPERVRCWYVAELNLITVDPVVGRRWKLDCIYTVTEGYFTAKGLTE